MTTIGMKNRYIAFISYQRQDETLAKRLQHTLEYYKLPVAVIEKEPSLKDGVRPIFVDMTELGDEPFLKPAIEQALKDSRFLIVICSPRSAQSKWVNKEVQYFLRLKRTKRIIPFIVEGNPNAINTTIECCTPLLKKLLGQRELLGININEMGFDAAAVKVVSRMFHVKFSSLWNRYEKEKEEEQQKLKEQNDRLLIAQSRFLAEKANDLIESGDSYLARIIALEALPLSNENPNRPYTPEAERVLRKACLSENATLSGHKESVEWACFLPNGDRLLSISDRTIKVWDANTGKIIHTIDNHSPNWGTEFISKDGKKIISASISNTIKVWDIETGECIRELNDVELPFSASFSPDGTKIVSNHEESIMVWDVNSWKCVQELNGHTATVYFTAFSPDGKKIISASWDQVNVYKRLS